MKVLVTQSCPTLCNHMDCSSPDSSVHEILQARILGWVAIPFSRGSSLLRDPAGSPAPADRFFTVQATKEAYIANKESMAFFLAEFLPGKESSSS